MVRRTQNAVMHPKCQPGEKIQTPAGLCYSAVQLASRGIVKDTRPIKYPTRVRSDPSRAVLLGGSIGNWYGILQQHLIVISSSADLMRPCNILGFEINSSREGEYEAWKTLHSQNARGESHHRDVFQSQWTVSGRNVKQRYPVRRHK